MLDGLRLGLDGNSAVDKRTVHEVMLVGGSTRIPKVQAMATPSNKTHIPHPSSFIHYKTHHPSSLIHPSLHPSIHPSSVLVSPFWLKHATVLMDTVGRASSMVASVAL